MNLRSVIEHPTFERARAWVPQHQGEAPARWLPAGLTRLDDSWFAEHPTRGPRRPPAAAFDALPEDLARRARAACKAAAGRRSALPAPLRVACARWCWADLVDLPPATHDEVALLPTLAEAWQDDDIASLLPRLSPSTVARAVNLAGVDDLGGLLALAPDRTAAAICSRLPDAYRERVWQGRAGNATPDRSALGQLSKLTRATDPSEMLFLLGARHFASLWSSRPLPLRQTAQLQPMPVARHLLSATVPAVSQESRDLIEAIRQAIGGADAPVA